MKAFLLACVSAVIIAIIGVVVLNSFRTRLTKLLQLPPFVLVSEVPVSMGGAYTSALGCP